MPILAQHLGLPKGNLPNDESFEKHYLCKVWRFGSGQVQALTTRVSSVARKRQAINWLSHSPIRLGAKPEMTDAEIQARDEAYKLRSVTRAKQTIRVHVKSINADHLLTLNYRSSEDLRMTDVERLKSDWDRFRRLVKKGLPACGKFKAHRGLPRWQYVACREQQDNGSWHLHVAVVGRQDINFLRRCWYVAVGGAQDDVGQDTKGQIDVRGPSKRWGVKTPVWKQDRLASYMTKYMAKLFDELEEKGAKRYWVARCNEAVKPERIWLGASSFDEAVVETHSLSQFLGAGYCNLWLSDGWDIIWCSG